MAIEITIKQGDEAAEKKDLLTAISKYTEALKENAETFTALIKRAKVYTKLSDYDSAKSDISKAFSVAEKRGKMADKASCHFRLGLVYYAQKDFESALVNLQKAKALRSSERALDIWISKAERDLTKTGALLKNDAKRDPTEGTGEVSKDTNISSSIETINKQAPLSIKIRDEWYQSKNAVTVTIFAKDISKDVVQVEFGKRSLSVTFPTSGASEYNYNLEELSGEIIPGGSSFVVTSKKIEITLIKKIEGKWAALEGESISVAPQTNTSGLTYPSSSRKKTDWASFTVNDEDNESADFFGKLYKDVDDDTRRAMMKSYVESNGTVLTTNWDEAKDKKFETSPPDGMVAKKWGQ